MRWLAGEGPCVDDVETAFTHVAEVFVTCEPQGREGRQHYAFPYRVEGAQPEALGAHDEVLDEFFDGRDEQVKQVALRRGQFSRRRGTGPCPSSSATLPRALDRRRRGAITGPPAPAAPQEFPR